MDFVIMCSLQLRFLTDMSEVTMPLKLKIYDNKIYDSASKNLYQRSKFHFLILVTCISTKTCRAFLHMPISFTYIHIYCMSCNHRNIK